MLFINSNNGSKKIMSGLLFLIFANPICLKLIKPTYLMRLPINLIAEYVCWFYFSIGSLLFLHFWNDQMTWLLISRLWKNVTILLLRTKMQCCSVAISTLDRSVDVICSLSFWERAFGTTLVMSSNPCVEFCLKTVPLTEEGMDVSFFHMLIHSRRTGVILRLTVYGWMLSLFVSIFFLCKL